MIARQRNRWLDWNVIATVLITKFLILGFAYQSFQVVNDQPVASSYRFFEIWKHWDAESYLKIAELGYSAVGERRFLIVYFPLYPSLVALVELLTGDSLISAFLVSLLSSVALGLVFKKLVRLDYSERISQYAVLFLFIFPTSYFLHIPYTESLFLALVIGCFVAARKRSWIVTGILGGLACMTRINGLVLLPALAFEVWSEYQETKKISRQWIWLIIVGVGFGLYLALNYFLTGSPTMFMTYQREHWSRFFRVPWEGLWEAAKAIYNRKPTESIMIGFQELLFVAIGFTSIVAAWRQRLRNSYLVWMSLNWLLFVSTSFVLSVPRYTLILFPLFILMAQGAVRNWSLRLLYTLWSILFLALFSTQFVRGWWAF